MTESAEQNPDAGPFEMLRHPAVRMYLFIASAALLIYFILMSSRGGELGTLLTILIAVPGLLARWVISPPLFLIFVTYLLVDPNFGELAGAINDDVTSGAYGYRRFGSSALELDTLILGAAILIYLIAQFRLLSFTHKSMPDDPPPRRKGQPEARVPRRPFKLFAENEIASMLFIALGSILVAVFIWFILTGYERWQHLAFNWGVARPFAHIMLFFWALGTGIVLTGSVLGYMGLRRMNRLQARLLLQDLFWQQTRREQERIHRWRRWHKKTNGTPAGDIIYNLKHAE